MIDLSEIIGFQWRGRSSEFSTLFHSKHSETMGKIVQQWNIVNAVHVPEGEIGS